MQDCTTIVPSFLLKENAWCTELCIKFYVMGFNWKDPLYLRRQLQLKHSTSIVMTLCTNLGFVQNSVRLALLFITTYISGLICFMEMSFSVM